MTAPAFRQTALAAVLRQDLVSFVRKSFSTLCPGQSFSDDWCVHAIAHRLERVRRGEIKRLIINLPPRSLKSIIASVAFPAFLLGHDPTRRIICVSYAAELARKHANDFRAVINSNWYKATFPQTRIGPFKDTEGEVEMTARGSRLSTSIGGTLTGRGGDIIIIDDPLKPIDALSEAKRSAVNEWFSNTLMSRLDNKQTGAIIVVMQRVHMDDLTGFLRGQSDEWEVLSLPAIAEAEEIIALPYGRFHHRRLGDVLSPSRESKASLERMRQMLGSAVFFAQYQQSPVPPGGVMIKRHWIKRYTALPVDTSARTILQSWDTAAKGGPENDWSVCTTWEHRWEQFHLIDVWRDRVDYPTLKRQVVEHAQRWTADQVLIEEAGTAIALLDELNFKVRGLTGVKPDRDKQTRMAVASAKFESGQVFFPEQAPWLAELEAELFAFPGGRHDDQVDSISQALNHEDSFVMWARLA